ncbi:heme ABC transporter ATP-binding protein [Promicromonospora sukumoe]|uniref:heme ABC transporter ATP-binding protein n=1 Tax=Promicromonospora sukumoe TaxID=88382 RepID=UPI00036084A5|nr:heme ABC transporter ATP-binding protein [Promicromonospora sukumoe]
MSGRTDLAEQPGQPALLTLTGVRVRAGDAVLLDDVDLDVRPGEVLVVVGPNGAGKSTLVSVLAGDRAPDAGQAAWTGTPLGAVRPAELARLRAVLLQENQVSFPFRVIDVVRMGRAPWQGSGSNTSLPDDDAVVARALDAADVAGLAERRFPTLSGGEKARTSFARLLAQDTTLLLLDEPTAALDVRHTEHVLRQARRHATGGGTVVVVLHDLALAAAWADRVLVLDGGRVAGLGAPAEVLTADLLSRVYEHPVDVVRHPVTGGLLVLPRYGHTGDHSHTGDPAGPDSAADAPDSADSTDSTPPHPDEQPQPTVKEAV